MSLEYYIDKWTNEQNNMAKTVITEDRFNIDEIKLVAGLDISFIKDSDDACVTVAILSFPSLDLVHQVSKMVTLKYPYIPGFLGFREVEHFLDLLNNLDPKWTPQLLLIDGNGIFHPRKFGSASHIGTLSSIPTIGISKNLFCIEQFTNEYVEEQLKKLDSTEKKI